jgi:hypothetical protein
MTELRNRLVTEQDGTEHVSGLVLAADEIPQALELEIGLHVLGGWDVTRYGERVRFEKNNVVRWVYVRSRPPMDDLL